VAKPLPDLPDGFAPAVLAAAPDLGVWNHGSPDLQALAAVDEAAFRHQLRGLGVRYVAVHPLELTDATRDAAQMWLTETFGPPARTSDPVLVYVVP